MIKPKRKRTLFHGLLMAAAQQPWLVSTIDSDGFVLMTAPIDTVANWANVSPRAIQVNVEWMKTFEPQSLDAPETVNTPAEWFFNLGHVLPDEAIPWYVELVENSKSSPRTNEKFTPNKCDARGEQMQKVHPKVRGELFIPSSMCLVLATASLAELAGLCEKSGIAMSCETGSWEGLTIDPDALGNPAVIDCLFRVAASSGVIEATATDRRRVFTAAAVSSRKTTAWRYFRNLLANRWHLTTEPNSQDSATAKRLRKLADALAVGPAQTPELVAVESPKQSAGPIPEEKLAATEFGRKLLSQRKQQAAAVELSQNMSAEISGR